MEKAFLRLSFILPLTGGGTHVVDFRQPDGGNHRGDPLSWILIHHFLAAPFHIGLALAVRVSSVIFGAPHLYQGIAGAISAAIPGFFSSAIFLITGTLLVPMVLHAFINLRVLLILRPTEHVAAGA